MSVFNVKIRRVTFDYLDVKVEASSASDIQEVLAVGQVDLIYEAADALKGLKSWHVEENSVTIANDEITPTKKHAELILFDDKKTYALVRAPKKPWVDPRQIALIPEEDDNA